jgi:hypothetical protein
MRFYWSWVLLNKYFEFFERAQFKSTELWGWFIDEKVNNFFQDFSKSALFRLKNSIDKLFALYLLHHPYNCSTQWGGMRIVYERNNGRKPGMFQHSHYLSVLRFSFRWVMA